MPREPGSAQSPKRLLVRVADGTKRLVNGVPSILLTTGRELVRRFGVERGTIASRGCERGCKEVSAELRSSAAIALALMETAGVAAIAALCLPGIRIRGLRRGLPACTRGQPAAAAAGANASREHIALFACLSPISSKLSNLPLLI
jgi:hypothetical protein